MTPLTPRTALYLLLDIVLLVVCLFHAPYLLDRPRLPLIAGMANNQVEASAILDQHAAGTIERGERILRWGNDSIRVDHDLEFLSDFQAVGDTVILTVAGHDNDRRVAVTMIPFYELRYVIIALMVGLVTWAVGVFVLLARPGERAAGALQWSLVCMGVSVMIAWGRTPPGDWFSELTRGTFFIVYTGVPAGFLFFTTLFPRPRYGPLTLNAAAIFGPAAVLTGILLSYHLDALGGRSLDAYRTFRDWYDGFQVMKLAFVGAGLYTIVHAYRTAESTAERKRMQWILWGLSIGPAPFLLLVTVPELFLPTGLVAEEFTLVFLVMIPLTFAISFVKYRILDIELVIKRTTVYALVVAVVLVVYAALVSAVSAYIGPIARGASAVAAVVVALLFEPVRRAVQHFVDRRFFRVEYDFREAGKRFLEEIGRAVDERQLGSLLVRQTNDVIPVERIGVFAFQPPGDRLILLAHDGFSLLSGRTTHFSWNQLHTPLDRPVALAGTVEPGVDVAGADPIVFRRWGMAVVFSIRDEKDAVRGFLVLGPRKSGTRFSAEDIDLLSQVAAESGMALERIVLQRELLLEQAETRRLDELNKLKSEFVSYVSHELRSPLTSIKLFTELLRSPRRHLDNKGKEFLRIIEGEADRLGRMITTILDSARIEQGRKEYSFTAADCSVLVRSAMEAMSFQLAQGGFRVRVSTPRSTLTIKADPDAVKQAIINIVSNAIKYSGERRVVTVRLVRKDRAARCSIADRGLGIPAESLPHIFERFYRDQSVQKKAQGVGLGLP
ncbi:MAG: HAMP domain-containing sensor histidine kinase, partial [Bacteroidota bacterium]